MELTAAQLVGIGWTLARQRSGRVTLPRAGGGEASGVLTGAAFYAPGLVVLTLETPGGEGTHVLAAGDPVRLEGS